MSFAQTRQDSKAENKLACITGVYLAEREAQDIVFNLELNLIKSLNGTFLLFLNAGSVPQHGSNMRRRHPYHLGFAYRGTKNMVMSILLCIGLCIAVEGTRRTQSLFVTGCIFTPEWNYITYLAVRWTPE